VAQDDSIQTEPNTPITILVLANDGDPNRDPSVAIEAGRLVDSRS